jgi:hypothetical protein
MHQISTFQNKQKKQKMIGVSPKAIIWEFEKEYGT